MNMIVMERRMGIQMKKKQVKMTMSKREKMTTKAKVQKAKKKH